MNSTKERVAHAFKEIVCRKSFQKITISDIARECDMTRENFYYHFRDKFDIIRWIMEKEIILSVSEIDDFIIWIRSVINICEKEKIFYIRIINEIGKDIIRENFTPMIKEKIMRCMEESLGDSIWNKRKEKVEFAAIFYADAFMELIFRCILDKDILHADQIASKLEFLVYNYMSFVRSPKEV